ncbi:hypothetical protein N9Y42_01995 [Mariniblastus sp.]|nr:hypothetical protein [Mariniblastus sp.]
MCIFAQPVIAVNNTQIFARLSGKGTQYLAYQMDYRSSEPNAMILPLPVRQPTSDDAVRFIDLKGYESFFDDLAEGFPFIRPPGGFGCSAPAAATKMTAAGLAVVKVGNYIASFVPSISDFDRLDPKFRLPDEIWASIPGYENFGFAVFQLAAGSLKPHPMALEFPTQTDDQEIFFPTIHIHDGEIHDSEKFDHALYLQHAGFDSMVSGYRNFNVEDPATGLVRSDKRASSFADSQKSAGLLEPDLLLHKKIMQGNLPNTDTTFILPGDPVKPSFNLRGWLPYAPWLVGLAAVGWFFNRRSKLRQSLETQALNTEQEEKG